ncbi:membrane protein insertase YidC 2 [Paenibacillus sp. J45TS6]|uniref:YidC/Oxa1 family membrane protein insertase n=1 Tax=unclassified Paenibacillus TaxID=185978 RepID=UPI001B17FD4F|nr:YidC/Oxa1 family membrane protein insertase [Paenibacillus sp. J45TS6]GIP42545.1 membrane protein insertase YidC 2 [Paenibacillus sp. J45TS6]
MSRLKSMKGKKWILLIAVIALVAVLSGCTSANTTHVTTEDLKNSGSFWKSNVVYWFSLSLDSLAKLFGGEYGLAILVLVIIVRTLILPLTIKQVKSSRNMQKIQPLIKEIQTKYKDTPEKIQAETMKLFQEHKVNPMAGCLPLIIQMPIYIALYNSILYNSNINQHTFLWMELGSPDKLFILPVLVAVSMFFQTWYMMKQNPSQQQGPMQFMLWVYPILMFIMSYQFASALPLYWFYSNIYTIIQNFFLYRNNDKLVAATNVEGTKSSSKKRQAGMATTNGVGSQAKKKKKKKKK